MKENQIVDIDGWVHVVNGKVICFTPDVYDLSNSLHTECLIDFVNSLDELYVSGVHPNLFGENTMEIVTKSLNENDPNGRIVSTADMQILSKDVLERIEVERNEYRSGIRDTVSDS